MSQTSPAQSPQIPTAFAKPPFRQVCVLRIDRTGPAYFMAALRLGYITSASGFYFPAEICDDIEDWLVEVLQDMPAHHDLVIINGWTVTQGVRWLHLDPIDILRHQREQDLGLNQSFNVRQLSIWLASPLRQGGSPLEVLQGPQQYSAVSSKWTLSFPWVLHDAPDAKLQCLRWPAEPCDVVACHFNGSCAFCSNDRLVRCEHVKYLGIDTGLSQWRVACPACLGADYTREDVRLLKAIHAVKFPNDTVRDAAWRAERQRVQSQLTQLEKERRAKLRERIRNLGEDHRRISAEPHKDFLKQMEEGG